MAFSREAASLYVKEVYEKCGSVEAGLWQLQVSVKKSLGSSRGGEDLFCKVNHNTESFPDVFSISPGNGSVELQRCAGEGRLVRCCGMIQDVQSDLTVMSGSPECFLSNLSDGGSGATCSGENGNKKELQRMPSSRRDSCCHVETAVLRVIPVPGNTWFYEGELRDLQEEKGERSSSSKERQRSLNVKEEKGAAVGQESRQEYSKKGHCTSTNDAPVLDRTMELAMNFPQPIFHPKLRASCMVTVLAPRYQNRGIEMESTACEGTVKGNSSPRFEEGDDAFLLDVSPFQINDVYEFYGYLDDDKEDLINGETKASWCDQDGNVKRKKKWEDGRKREKDASDEDHEGSESSEGDEKIGIPFFAEEDGEIGEAWHPTKSYRQAGAHVTHLLSVAATRISSANTYGVPFRMDEEEEGKKNGSGDAGGTSPSSPTLSESDAGRPSPPTAENVSKIPCGGSTLTSSPSSEWFEEGRASSIRFLRQHICHGDALVAEYLLLHLCSHVLVHASATPLGDVPLLIRCPSSLLSGKMGQEENVKEGEHEDRALEEGAAVLRRWVKAFRFLVPVAAVAIDKDVLQLATDSSKPLVQSGKKRTGAERTTLKVKNCAARHLTPQYESCGSYLSAGSLQLANGTNLVIDCTGMVSGGNASSSSSGGGLLDEKSNIYDILFSLVHQCCLPIDYPYYRVELPVSLSVLAIASEHEVLPEMLTFPLSILLHVDPTQCSLDTFIVESEEKAGEGNCREKSAYLSPRKFGPVDVRSYIAAVRRQSTINFSLRKQHFTPAVMEVLTDSFSQLGKEFDNWNNHQSLIHNNIFSVATSLVGVEVASRGRSGVTEQDIHYFADLERKRMASLRSFSRVNNV